MNDSVVQKIINAVLKVIVPDKIILFGSQARGNARPDSDYDILIIKSGIENESEIEGNIYVKLFYEDFLASVDVIVAKPEDIEKYKDKTGCFLKSALKEGVIVYGG